MVAWQPASKKPNLEKWQLVLFAFVFMAVFFGIAVLIWLGQYIVSLGL
jgi:hypothetical protein